MSSAKRWTGGVRRRFLAALAATGSVHAALRAVDRSKTHAYRLRGRDLAFAAAWDAAVEHAADALMPPRPAAGTPGAGGHRGGHAIRRHSDKLMGLLLRGHRPEKYVNRPDGAAAGTATPVIDTGADWADETRIPGIALTEHQQRFIAALVESGRYHGVSEVVGAGLRLLEAQEETRMAAFRRIEAAFEARFAGSDAVPLKAIDAIIAKADRGESEG